MNLGPWTLDLGPWTFPSDRPREECGIFAVYGHEDAAKLAYFGLYALQHRGQESAGIVASDGRRVVEHKAMGLVPEIFNERNLETLRGNIALGHVRYSTTGSSLLVNAQPLRIQHSGKTLAIAHNGNLVNAREIRARLEEKGAIFQTTMDSEVVLHILARAGRKGLEQAVIETMDHLKGAYSMVIMTEDTPHRHEGPQRLPAPVSGPSEWRVHRHLRDLRPGPGGGRIRPGGGARGDPGDQSPGPPEHSIPALRPARPSASSSSSTLRGRTATCSAKMCTSSARGRENSWPRSFPWRRIW